MSVVQKNLFFSLPKEIQIYIYSFTGPDDNQREFFKNYKLYYKLFRNIKSNQWSRNIIYIKFVDGFKDFNFKYKYYKLGNDNNLIMVNDIFIYNCSLYNKIELNNEIDDYLKENICYIHKYLNDYRSILLDKYYIKNNFFEGFKKSTLKKITKYLNNEDNENLFKMLDLNTMKHNYFLFNSVCDLMNFEYISELEYNYDLVCRFIEVVEK